MRESWRMGASCSRAVYRANGRKEARKDLSAAFGAISPTAALEFPLSQSCRARNRFPILTRALRRIGSLFSRVQTRWPDSKSCSQNYLALVSLADRDPRERPKVEEASASLAQLAPIVKIIFKWFRKVCLAEIIAITCVRCDPICRRAKAIEPCALAMEEQIEWSPPQQLSFP